MLCIASLLCSWIPSQKICYYVLCGKSIGIIAVENIQLNLIYDFGLLIWLVHRFRLLIWLKLKKMRIEKTGLSLHFRRTLRKIELAAKMDYSDNTVINQIT